MSGTGQYVNDRKYEIMRLNQKLSATNRAIERLIKEREQAYCLVKLFATATAISLLLLIWQYLKS